MNQEEAVVEKIDETAAAETGEVSESSENVSQENKEKATSEDNDEVKEEE